MVITDADAEHAYFLAQGKLLNVTDASAQKLADNKEIGYLKQILGLKHSFKYSDLSQLRYGRVLIASDADVDGSHISEMISATRLDSLNLTCFHRILSSNCKA